MTGNSSSLRRIGLGCMPLTGIYGPIERDRAIAIVRYALELGITHFDTAELYGPYLNEELLADALGSHQAHVEIASKFGYRFQDGKIVGLDSRPHSIRLAVEGSLRRLRRDHLDMLYQHRPDPAVPVEEVVGTMSDLAREGKVLHLGLSATDAVALHRASAIHPISFVQNEFSLIQRAPEEALVPDLLRTSTELVCYSPLGRGLLAGPLPTDHRRPASDYRGKDPRYQPERLTALNGQLAPLWRISAARSVSPAVISLAWLLAKSPTIRVIPSATSLEQLKTNVRAADLVLTSREIAELELIGEMDGMSRQ